MSATQKQGGFLTQHSPNARRHVSIALASSLFSGDSIILSQHCAFLAHTVSALLRADGGYSNVRIVAGSVALRTLPRCGEFNLQDTTGAFVPVFHVLSGDENGTHSKVVKYLGRDPQQPSAVRLNGHFFVRATRVADNAQMEASLAEGAWFNGTFEAGGAKTFDLTLPAENRGRVCVLPVTEWHAHGIYFTAAPDTVQPLILNKLIKSTQAPDDAERPSARFARWEAAFAQHDSVDSINCDLVMLGSGSEPLTAVGADRGLSVVLTPDVPAVY